jgi:hypothetical protein
MSKQCKQLPDNYRTSMCMCTRLHVQMHFGEITMMKHESINSDRKQYGFTVDYANRERDRMTSNDFTINGC